MSTSKLAKCGLYKYSFCTHKHNAVECANCLLVKRHGKMYKFIEGKKYKKCPHCGEYKPLNEFKTNSQGDISWCYECQKTNAREYARRKKVEEKKQWQIMSIGYNDMMTSNELLNFIKDAVINNKDITDFRIRHIKQ